MIDLYRMDSEGPGRETGKGASSSRETSVVNSAGAEATFAKYTVRGNGERVCGRGWGVRCCECWAPRAGCERHPRGAGKGGHARDTLR